MASAPELHDHRDDGLRLVQQPCSDSKIVVKRCNADNVATKVWQ